MPETSSLQKSGLRQSIAVGGKTRPRLRRLLVWSSLPLAIFFGGGYAGRHNLFPFSTIHSMHELVKTHAPSRFRFDETGRLTFDDRKKSLPCPMQSARTAVLLVLGQSNAGNHGGQRFRSEHEEQIINFADGKCFIAESPLIGSDGVMGEYWTQLANLLIERRDFDRVILAPASISGSAVSRWSPGGDLHSLMTSTTDALTLKGYRITHVLWHQGEFDYVSGTSEKAYGDSFIALAKSLRARQVDAPIYVSTTSKCLGESNGGGYSHSPDNPVVRAQQALPAMQPGIAPGINTDALLSEYDRYDDCHFGGSGEEKAAEAWADRLADTDPAVPATPAATGTVKVHDPNHVVSSGD